MGILTGLSLFSGAGGLDLAAKRAGIRTLGYVELDRYAQGVLMSRMRDGSLDPAPIFSDIREFDGKPWRGKVDIVFGGFPCQPHSNAGKQGGADDERNLWPDYLRIVREVRPTFVVGENVPGIFDTGYAVHVLADLEENGYCATPYSISAEEVGAPHRRERIFFLAHLADAKHGRCNGEGVSVRWEGQEKVSVPPRTGEGVVLADAGGIGPSNGEYEVQPNKARINAFNDPAQNGEIGVGQADSDCSRCERPGCSGAERIPEFKSDVRIWPARPGEQQFCWEPPRLLKPGMGGSPDGMAYRADRLRCIGNGVVPQQAAPAFQLIKELAGMSEGIRRAEVQSE